MKDGKVELRSAFAENIIQYRKSKGHNQKSAAEYLKVKRCTLAAWEERRAFPTVEVLMKISIILKKSTDDLLFNKISW